MKHIKNVHIIGMGALGTLFGSYIIKAFGENAVQFIVDEDRYARYLNKNITCNGTPLKFHITKAMDAKPADLVIVAVKATALKSAIGTMRTSVGENTVIISVLNGITSEKILAEHFGMDNIVDCVAVGMDAMKFGDALTYTTPGKLHIGIEVGQRAENLDAVANFLGSAGIPYVIDEDIVKRMWGKFMLNVGINQTCMVYGTTYGETLTNGAANDTFLAAMREVISIANAEGIDLTEKDLQNYVDITSALRPDGTPSMGQDRICHRKSEVDIFAGTVIRIAKKHNIPVPVNEYLYKRVLEIESEYP